MFASVLRPGVCSPGGSGAGVREWHVCVRGVKMHLSEGADFGILELVLQC